MLIDQFRFWDGRLYRGRPLSEHGDLALDWVLNWHDCDDDLTEAVLAEQARRQARWRARRRLLARRRVGGVHGR
jgi:hypothetical protein